LELQEGEYVSENEVEQLMKRHPPWFMFDFHPIRSAKKLSEEEQEDEKGIETDRGKE